MRRLTTIRQLPCIRCQAPPPSQACHANWQEFGKGMGKKADDSYTIPLCLSCHQWLDQYWQMSRDEAKEWFLEKWAFVNGALEMGNETAF
ncbi:hypothetical protein LU290_03365 [Moraxella nasibovis]|uniref:hypothetical protein n=1 Tax=Moraxella nasibovis TaxID=2904120 RepID=UPI002410294E|nr:hypothetical protein [Moraxella nasibovis]WFF39275.1 hypothetical protein LU290_03365 [Moraxella nasibovis]